MSVSSRPPSRRCSRNRCAARRWRRKLVNSSPRDGRAWRWRDGSSGSMNDWRGNEPRLSESAAAHRDREQTKVALLERALKSLAVQAIEQIGEGFLHLLLVVLRV